MENRPTGVLCWGNVEKLLRNSWEPEQQHVTSSSGIKHGCYTFVFSFHSGRFPCCLPTVTSAPLFFMFSSFSELLSVRTHTFDEIEHEQCQKLTTKACNLWIQFCKFCIVFVIFIFCMIRVFWFVFNTILIYIYTYTTFIFDFIASYLSLQTLQSAVNLEELCVTLLCLCANLTDTKNSGGHV